MRITKQEVIKYMDWRAGEELRHCPNSIAAACNDAAIKFNHFNACLLYTSPSPRDS